MTKIRLIFIAIFFIPLFGIGQLRVKKMIELPSKIYETSGLIYYKNKYIITHNDGGNKSEIFILNRKGQLLKTIDVKGEKNHDWEDIAQDQKGNVFIGEFGNNNNNRKNLEILILKNGFIDKKSVEPDKIDFEYEDQEDFPPKEKKLNFDCEAFFEKDGYLYLLTKCRTKPFTGISNVYVMPAKKGKHKAKLIGQFQFCSSNWQFCSVTGADYNYEKKELSILTYSRLYVISDFKSNQFWKGKIKKYDILGIKQREAVAYLGNDKWIMSDEYKKGIGGGNLYEMYLKN
jgi:hypothetical protein